MKERIALLHYTALPAIGGIESLIESQGVALLDLGWSVQRIVGEGADGNGVETVCLPLLQPAHPDVIAACLALDGALPDPGHPLVSAIERQVRQALGGCTQVWVHNAFTVLLNPFLTVALRGLTDTMRELRWVAWCEDVSATSAYVQALPVADHAYAYTGLPNVTYVTISRARRAELADLFSLPEEAIRTISPPLDALSWLGIGEEARELVSRLDLLHADPIVLVPAKLLPHKNLELAVRIGSELRAVAPRPAILLTTAPSPHDCAGSEAVEHRLISLSETLHAAGTVHFLGKTLGRPLQHGTVRDLMLLADLVLLTSTEEGFGIPLQEAAVLRVPVLCSRIDAFQEAGVESARYFSLFDPPNVIVQSIMSMAAEPANRRRREVLGSWVLFRRQIQCLADGDATRNG